MAGIFILQLEIKEGVQLEKHWTPYVLKNF